MTSVLIPLTKKNIWILKKVINVSVKLSITYADKHLFKIL